MKILINIIILLLAFVSNTSAQNNNILDITLNGYITDAQTREALEGIETTLYLFEWPIPIDTLGPINTDINGYYSFTITGIEDVLNIETVGEIRYSIINTPTIELNLKKTSQVQIKIFDLLGQELKTLLNEVTKQKTINADIDRTASGVYILQILINGKPYNNTILKVSNSYLFGKNRQLLTNEGKKQTLGKLVGITPLIKINDLTNQHHAYHSAAGQEGSTTSNSSFNMALPKVVYLPDSMQFTDPEVEYPINTEIQLWQYSCRIINQDDYKSIGVKLMPMKIFEPGTQPQWTQPIIDGINHIRSRTTVNPDSLVQITNEGRAITFENGFSQINIVYSDSIEMGQDDYQVLFFYSSSHDAFCGGELYINISTNQQPIDIYKVTHTFIQKYLTAGIYPINNPKFMSTNTRGYPYEPTDPEMHLIDITRNMQDIIGENDGQRIWINRFLHPGTVVTNERYNTRPTKEEILKRFENVPGVKVKVID